MKAACPELIKLLGCEKEEGEEAADIPLACCVTITSLAAVESNSDIMGEAGGLAALAGLLPGAEHFRDDDLSLAAMRALASLLLFSDQNRQVHWHSDVYPIKKS